MPIYLYRCEDCRETVEKLQKVSDSPLVDCPHCGSPSLKKIIAPVGIAFKGGGFYVNDSSSGSSKSSSKSTSSEKKTKSSSKDSSSAKGSGKSEAKKSSSSTPKAGS